MESPADLLRAALAMGHTLDDALAELRSSGATPVETIKAIYDVNGVDLGEAKRIFASSPAWASEARAADALHDEVFSILEKGEK
jgi:hypothetical protein